MRLTTEQITVIKQKTALIFGDDAQVYLFGSRADDDTKGGDIDLFINLTGEIENPFAKTIRLNGVLQQEIGMQKIDIIFHTPSYDCLFIPKQKSEAFFYEQ
jgi:predicted nucleotidyltransferase